MGRRIRFDGLLDVKNELLAQMLYYRSVLLRSLVTHSAAERFFITLWERARPKFLLGLRDRRTEK